MSASLPCQPDSQPVWHLTPLAFSPEAGAACAFCCVSESKLSPRIALPAISLADTKKKRKTNERCSRHERNVKTNPSLARKRSPHQICHGNDFLFLRLH